MKPVVKFKIISAANQASMKYSNGLRSLLPVQNSNPKENGIFQQRYRTNNIVTTSHALLRIEGGGGIERERGERRVIKHQKKIKKKRIGESIVVA